MWPFPSHLTKRFKALWETPELALSLLQLLEKFHFDGWGMEPRHHVEDSCMGVSQDLQTLGLDSNQKSARDLFSWQSLAHLIHQLTREMNPGEGSKSRQACPSCHKLTIQLAPSERLQTAALCQPPMVMSLRINTFVSWSMIQVQAKLLFMGHFPSRESK